MKYLLYIKVTHINTAKITLMLKLNNSNTFIYEPKLWGKIHLQQILCCFKYLSCLFASSRINKNPGFIFSCFFDEAKFNSRITHKLEFDAS